MGKLIETSFVKEAFDLTVQSKSRATREKEYGFQVNFDRNIAFLKVNTYTLIYDQINEDFIMKL